MKKIRRAISLIIRNKEGKVFVVRRSPNKNSFPGCLSFPAVYLEDEESFSEAANRLVQEKLGLESVRIKPRPLGVSGVVERKDSMLEMHDFEVEEWRGEIRLNPEEYTEFLWLTPLELRGSISSENNGAMGECTRTFLKSEGLLK